MTYGRLRNVSKFSIIVGFGFICSGVTLFMFGEAGDKIEKIGIILMMYELVPKRQKSSKFKQASDS